jgi:hypothetical protein
LLKVAAMGEGARDASNRPRMKTRSKPPKKALPSVNARL